MAAVVISVALLVALESAAVDLAMSLPPTEHHAMKLIRVLRITVVANRSVLLPVLPECAAAYLAISYPPMI